VVGAVDVCDWLVVVVVVVVTVTGFCTEKLDNAEQLAGGYHTTKPNHFRSSSGNVSIE
jgi:hypothetical protein